MPISSSPFLPFDRATAAHNPITSPQLAGSSLSPPANLHYNIPQCETRNKHRPPTFASWYGVLSTCPPPSAPHQTRGFCRLGETHTQERRNTSQRNRTTSGEGRTDWLCDTSHFPSAQRSKLTGQMPTDTTRSHHSLSAPARAARYPSLVIHSSAILICVSLTWCELLTVAYLLGCLTLRERIVARREVNCDDAGAGSGET
jgi:hypothetical protein